MGKPLGKAGGGGDTYILREGGHRYGGEIRTSKGENLGEGG